MRHWSWPWSFRPGATLPSKRFGFAVVGLGHGALKFLEAVQASPHVRVAALVSGDERKAERLAHRFHVPSVYTYANMDRLYADSAVQAVYLCLPNGLHREFTERAAGAGLHVLCEKPMAASVDDCHAMIRACGRADRLLMIGYRSPFSAVHRRAREVLQSGALGRVQAVRSGFGFVAKSGWRLDPALAGGGSLYDVGIYPIHSLHHLLAEEFAIDAATMQRDPRTGLETATTWNGTLHSGAAIACESSYLQKIPNFFEIDAERGTLLLKPAFSYASLQLQMRARNRKDRKELDLDLSSPRAEVSAFRLEAEHLAHCANTGTPVITPGETGMRDMQTIAKIQAIASVIAQS